MADSQPIPATAASAAEAPVRTSAQAAQEAGINDPLTDHEYDGIQEYDNPTPGWWWYIFIISIVFSVVYWFYYETGSPYDRSIHGEYKEALAENVRVRFAKMGTLEQTNASLKLYAKNEDYMAVGESLFRQQCVSCHSQNGEGSVGPNLTDHHYKWIKQPVDIVKVLNEGAAGGAMPGWKNRFHPNEITLLASFIVSMRGKNLPGPRGAEGEVAPDW